MDLCGDLMLNIVFDNDDDCSVFSIIFNGDDHLCAFPKQVILRYEAQYSASGTEAPTYKLVGAQRERRSFQHIPVTHIFTQRERVRALMTVCGKKLGPDVVQHILSYVLFSAAQIAAEQRKYGDLIDLILWRDDVAFAKRKEINRCQKALRATQTYIDRAPVHQNVEVQLNICSSTKERIESIQLQLAQNEGEQQDAYQDKRIAEKWLRKQCPGFEPFL